MWQRNDRHPKSDEGEERWRAIKREEEKREEVDCGL